MIKGSLGEERIVLLGRRLEVRDNNLFFNGEREKYWMKVLFEFFFNIMEYIFEIIWSCIK